LPATAEELTLQREADRRFLVENLPRLRGSPGWQTGESRTTLDAWERDLRQKLKANDTEGD
jgi:hypothetical protein